MASRPSGQTGAKAKILIVDDHQIVRQGMALLLGCEADLDICGEAADAEEALALLHAQLPDLIIIDISLPGVSGLDLIKQIKARYAQLPMLVMSMHDESLYLERAFHAGARGYVMKEEGTEKVLQAVRKLLAGDLYVSDKMQNVLLGRALGGVSAQPGTLTEREFEVLRLIGLGRGTSEIATELRRSVKTIESHRANIKDKLGLRSSAELARYATRWVDNQAEQTNERD